MKVKKLLSAKLITTAAIVAATTFLSACGAKSDAPDPLAEEKAGVKATEDAKDVMGQLNEEGAEDIEQLEEIEK